MGLAQITMEVGSRGAGRDGKVQLPVGFVAAMDNRRKGHPDEHLMNPAWQVQMATLARTAMTLCLHLGAEEASATSIDERARMGKRQPDSYGNTKHPQHLRR